MKTFNVRIKEKKAFDEIRSINVNVKAENPGSALTDVVKTLKVNENQIASIRIETKKK